MLCGGLGVLGVLGAGGGGGLWGVMDGGAVFYFVFVLLNF